MAPTSNAYSFLVHPTDSQVITLQIIGIYAGVILILWNLPYLHYLLWPFKIFTVALHEFSHALMGICTGARIESITLDPNEGGLTKMRGGNPYATLPAGYLGSNIFGALMVFAGFNTLASKYAAGVVAVAMFVTLIFARNWLAGITTIAFGGIIGFLWWYENAAYLRFFILFLGVMSCLYSLWDIIDDLITRRVNESDASKYARICCKGCMPPQAWGVIWFLVSLLFLAGAIIGAMAAFKDPSATFP